MLPSGQLEHGIGKLPFVEEKIPRSILTDGVPSPGTDERRGNPRTEHPDQAFRQGLLSQFEQHLSSAAQIEDIAQMLHV